MELHEKERQNRAMIYVEKLNYRDRVTTPIEVERGVPSYDDGADIPPAKILKHLKWRETREFGYKVLEKLLVHYSRTDARIRILSAFDRHPAMFPDWNKLTVVKLILSHLKSKEPISGCRSSSELPQQLFFCLKYIGERPSIFPSNTIFFLAAWSDTLTDGQQIFISRWTCSSLCNPKRRPCDEYNYLRTAQPMASSGIPPDKIIKHLTSPVTRDFGYRVVKKLLIQYCSTYTEIGTLSAFARQPAMFRDWKTLTVVKLVISHLKCKETFSGCFRCSRQLLDQLLTCLRYIGENPCMFCSLALRGKMFTEWQNTAIRTWTSSSVCNQYSSSCNNCSRSLETETDMKRSFGSGELPELSRKR